MLNLQKSGGLAALILAATYIIGFTIFLGFIDRTGYEGTAGDIRFLADNLQLMNFAMLLLYIVAGCALVVLGLALHHRLKPHTGPGLQVAGAFAIIWATIVLASGMVGLIGMEQIVDLAKTEPEQAASAWVAIAVVQDALGGGIELVGGVWIVLISAFALSAHQLPRWLNILGMVVGLAGILSVFPGLSDAVDIFGLGQIVWFIWAGIDLLRTRENSAGISS